jgi:abortive infection bacteriophage resistance protein
LNGTGHVIKPHLQYPEVVEQLRGRGLEIGPESEAVATLKRVGYYRFSAYLYPYRAARPHGRDDNFVAGAKFSHAVDRYDFDQRLRSILAEALSVTEIALGARVAHVLGALDPQAHLDRVYLDASVCARQESFNGSVKDAHEAWLARYEHLRDGAKDEEYVKHHILQYGGRIPIWAAVQFMDFGCILRLYTMMRPREQRKVAEIFGFKNDQTGRLAKLLRPLNVLRNNCVHNNRVWNRSTIYPPARIPSSMIGSELLHFNQLTEVERQRLYALAALLAYFIRHVHPGSFWTERFRDFILASGSIGGMTPQSSMGFPLDWESLALWNPARP